VVSTMRKMYCDTTITLLLTNDKMTVCTANAMGKKNFGRG
jgi:hypothetical protein